MRLPEQIRNTLQKLEAQNALRMLDTAPGSLIDFSSNDYLGLARFSENTALPGQGSGGSRLLSGNHPAHENLEAYCASFFKAEAALLFNSGYLANLGLLSAVPQRGDTILYDSSVHASVKDGMRLSPAKRHPFRHRDHTHLEQLLQRANGQTFVVVEGLYSMEGDQADLPALLGLCETHGAFLIVDEAHSTGVLGPQGAGLGAEPALADQIFARVCTFGKAAGWHGAVVLGSQKLKAFLVNRARSFIYTTAMPPGDAVFLQHRLAAMAAADVERAQLRLNWQRLMACLGWSGAEFSPIVPVRIPGNAAVKAVAQELRSAGLDARPILAPTVPVGMERLRVVLHSFNALAEIEALGHLLKKISRNCE